MERWLGRYSDRVYAVLRIVTGLLFACHGAQKLFGCFEGQAQLGNPLMLTAGIVEFFGGVLVLIGLAGGFAGFLCSGQMAAAYFMAHAPRGFWPIVNGGELAVAYCFVFLYIASKGSGPLSVDALIRKGRA